MHCLFQVVGTLPQVDDAAVTDAVTWRTRRVETLLLRVEILARLNMTLGRDEYMRLNESCNRSNSGRRLNLNEFFMNPLDSGGRCVLGVG